MKDTIPTRKYPVLPRVLEHLRPLQTSSLPAEGLLSRLLRRLHERWRLRRLTRGLIQVLLFWFVVLIAASGLLHESLFDDRLLIGLQLLHYGALIYLVWRFVVRPLHSVNDDARVARYLEERRPELGSLVSSAIETSRRGEDFASTQMSRKLVDQATAAITDLNSGDALEDAAIRKAGAGLYLSIVAILFIVALSAPLRQALPVLLVPWNTAAQWSPFSITSVPGDSRIARGEDLLISATTIGFSDRPTTLNLSRDGGVTWQQLEMVSTGEADQFEYWLFDVQDELQYYISAEVVSSDRYRISLFNKPTLDSLGLTLTPPAYTRRPTRQINDSGDFDALIGTRVDFAVRASDPIQSAVLKFTDGSQQVLTGADRDWTGSYYVSGDATYSIQFEQKDGEILDVSGDYFIRLVDDLLPMVTIQSPGRDSKVSMIEEPVLRLQASDDQGIDRVDLVLSVNGGEETRIPLLTDADDEVSQQVELEHVFYLENLPLGTGDLLSYYVETVELGPEGNQRRVTSDIYFFEIRPFRNNFFKADQQAGGGGGGSGQQGNMQDQQQLAEQQKQLVIATFKLVREEERFGEAANIEEVGTLGIAQERIRSRVEAIVRRIGGRAVPSDPRIQEVRKELDLAVKAMRIVEDEFSEQELNTALLNAQLALKHLQRADSVFRDITVSMGQQQGNASASGNSQNMQELADLFRLELDRLRNQYETLPQGGQRSQQQQMDETLEQLREMARRQQQQIERQLQRNQQANSSAEAARQRALAEQLEAMARELERLTRERPDRAMEESVERMRSAAESMRRSADGSGNSLSDTRDAAEDLREAERILNEGRQQRFSEAVERTLRQVEDALRQQKGITDMVEDAASSASDLRQEINRDKERLLEQLDEVNSELRTLGERARTEQPETNQSIRQAMRAAQENRLNDRINRSRGMMNRGLWDFALENEEQIEQGITSMRDILNNAVNQASSGQGENLEQDLEQMRRMAREMRALRDRNSNQQDSGQSQGQQQSAQGQGGQQAGTGDGDYRGGGGWFWRETQAMQQRGQSMIDRLEEQGVDEADLETLSSRLEAIAEQQNNADRSVFDDALRSLLDLEYKIRSSLEEEDISTPPIVDSIEIPEEFEGMVADYYRSLSE